MENDKGVVIFVAYENKQGYSYGLSISSNDVCDANVVLPVGIHFGDTKKSVIAVYGEPSNTYDSKKMKIQFHF